jgi:hypothetical protein
MTYNGEAMRRHFILLDANVPAAHFAPKSTQSRTLIARSTALLSGQAPNLDVRFLIPNFCIAEVFSVFEKYRWGRTWNPRVSAANTLTPREFSSARRGFGDAIHNASKILQVELDRYHILAVDLISPINNAYQINRARKGPQQTRRRPATPASTYDMLVAAMAIWLSQQYGPDDFTLVTGDGRLANVINRARSASLGAPIRTHLADVAQRLGLTYGPALYPNVLNLTRATRTQLRQRFPDWSPAW